MRNSPISARIWVVLLWSCGMLAGCAGGIPDIKPFQEATVALRNGSSASFAETISATREIRSAMDEIVIPQSPEGAAAQKKLYDDTVEYLEKFRDARMAVLNGMVEYANALNRVAAEGQGRIDRANEITASTKKAIDTVTGALPIVTAGTSDFVKQGVDIFTSAANRAFGAYQAAKTNRDLYAKMEANQAAVDALVDGLTKDLDKLSGLLSNLAFSADAQLGGEPSARKLAVTRASLVTRRLEINRPDINETALRTAMQIEADLERVNAALAPIETRRAETARRFELSQGVITSAKDALKAWQGAHGNLKHAVQNNSVLDAAELKGAVEELRAELKRFRDFADKVAESRKKRIPA
jgi:hypothetical protein